MPDPYKIQSREEHILLIRKIWKWCFIAASLCLVAMVAMILVMHHKGYKPSEIVAVQLLLIYILVPIYAVGYIGPAFATSLLKMALAVEMSREGLEIGKSTMTTIAEVKDEVKPLVKDVKQVVADVQPMVKDISAVVKESKKVFDDLVKEVREGNGQLHGKIGDTLKKAVTEARKTIHDAEGDLEQVIWKKVDQFLAGVFDGKEEAVKEPPDEVDMVIP